MKKKSTEKRSKLFGRPDALLVEEGVAGGTTPPPIELDAESRPGRRRPRPLSDPSQPEPPPPVRIDTSGAFGPLIAGDDEEVLATEEDDGSSDEDSFSLSLDDAREADEADTVLNMDARPRPVPPGDRSGLRLQATARPAARPAPDNDEFDLKDLVETVRTRTAPVRLEEEPPGEVMEFDAGVLDEGYESADSVFAQASAGRIPIVPPRPAAGPIPEDLPGLRGERTATAPATAPPRRIQPTLAPAPDYFPEPSTSPKPLPPRPIPASPRAEAVSPSRSEAPRVEPARSEPARITPVRRDPVRAEPAADVLRAPPRPGPPHPATQRAASLPSPLAHPPPPPRPPEPPARSVSATSADGIALLGFGVLVGLMISGGGLWAWSKLAPESAPLRLTSPEAAPAGEAATEGAAEAAPVAATPSTDPTAAASAGDPTAAPAAAATDPSTAQAAATDAKATDATVADPKATDAKATDAKATEAKAADTKAADTKATAAKATDTKATATKATDTKASAAKTATPPATSRAETPPPAQVGRVPASAASIVESGYLRVQSDTKCLVIVDGRQRGYAPDLGLIELPQGEHQVKCVVAGTGKSRTMSVRVDAGTLRAVQLTFAD